MDCMNCLLSGVIADTTNLIDMDCMQDLLSSAEADLSEGAYVCTTTPGEFVWQPGPLTQVSCSR